MKFDEILNESRSFTKKELERIKKYTTSNGGWMHQIADSSKIKLSFTAGQYDKIVINKADVMYSIITGDTVRRFKNFDSLVNFLEKET